MTLLVRFCLRFFYLLDLSGTLRGKTTTTSVKCRILSAKRLMSFYFWVTPQVLIWGWSFFRRENQWNGLNEPAMVCPITIYANFLIRSFLKLSLSARLRYRSNWLNGLHWIWLRYNLARRLYLFSWGIHLFDILSALQSTFESE